MRRTTLLLRVRGRCCAAAPAPWPRAAPPQCRQPVKLAASSASPSLVARQGQLPHHGRRTPATSPAARRASTSARSSRRRAARCPPAGRSTWPARPSRARTAADAFSVAIVAPARRAGGGLSWSEIQDWAVLWLPIIFLGVVAFAILWMLRYMPRTKPQEIKPSASGAVRWDDVAGRRGVEGRAARGGRVPARPEALPQARRARPARHPAARPARHRQDAARQGGRARVERHLLRPVGLLVRRDVRRPRRRAHPAAVPPGAQGDARRSSSSTSSTPSAPRAARTSRARRTRRSTSCWSSWTASPTRDEVVVIAASNLLDKLDPALLRPGRFDRQIFVSPPDLKGRRAILDVHTRDKPLAEQRRPRHDRPPDQRPDRRRPRQPLQRGGDLRRPRPPRRSCSRRDFQHALERVIAGVQSRRVITEHEKRVVAYHEAGHALCSELLPSVEKVHRISIIPRGKALGYTLNLPEEDRYLKTQGRAARLHGRAARRPRDRAARVRIGHHGRLRRPAQGPRDQPLDDHDVRHGHRARLQAAARRRLLDVRPHAPDDRRGAAVPDRPRAPARDAGSWPRTGTLLEAFAFTLLENEVLEREDIERLVAATRQPADAAQRRAVEPGPASVAAAEGERDRPAVAARRAAQLTSEPRVRADRSHRRGRRRPRRGRRALLGAARHAACSTARRWRQQGVEAVLLGVGESHVELLRPLGPGHGRRQVPGAQRPGPAPRGLRRPTTSTSALEAARAAGLRLIDEHAAHGHPGQPRGVRAPEVHRRRADRTC